MDQSKYNATNKPEETAEEVRGLFEQLMNQEVQKRETAAPASTPAEEEASVRLPLPEEQSAMEETQPEPVPVEDVPATEVTQNHPAEESAEWESSSYASLPLILLTPDEEEAEDWPMEYHPRDEESQGEDIPAPPANKRNPLLVLWEAFRSNIPTKGDSRPELIRKVAFLLALVVLISSLGYILYDVCILPSMNNSMYQNLSEQYDPDNDRTMYGGVYPTGMLESFCGLYDQNDEVRGWISYHANAKKDFLKIEYPIMYSGDNDKYLKLDFNQKRNKNGALFFDMRNTIEPFDNDNKALIVYGHNMASGQMFAGLNKFIGNVNNARAAATLTMSTLFEHNTYKVFAVVLTDEQASNEHYFDTRRTMFASDEDFLNYVAELRARSLFDYPVDVEAEDDLLVLSTCTAPSSAKVKDGRLVIIARKVRFGESTMVQTTQIVKNEDAIMPYAWYTLQDQQPHPYYGGEAIDVNGTTTTPSSDWTDIYPGITDDVLNSTDDSTTSTLDGEDTTTGNGSSSTKKGETTKPGGTTKPAGTTKPGGTTKPTSSTTVKPGASSTTKPAEGTSTEKPADTTSTEKPEESTTSSTEETTTTTSTEETTTTTQGDTSSAEGEQGGE